MTMIQTHGIGEFSYGGLAKAAGIRAASIHHHFPRKDQLIAEVAERYRCEFNTLLEHFTAQSAVERLVQYSAIYMQAAQTGRNCLCGAVAAEWTSIGDDTKEQVACFFAEQLEWLRGCIVDGQRLGEIRSPGVDPYVLARSLFAQLQGALVLARTDPTFADIVSMTRDLLRHVEVEQVSSSSKRRESTK